MATLGATLTTTTFPTGLVFDAVTEYGLSTGGTATANAAAIHNALAAAALVGGSVYIRGANAMYDVNQITMPSAPVRLFGDGPQASVLRGAAGITVAVITYNPATALPSGTGPFGVGNLFYRGQIISVESLGVTSYDEGVSTNHGLNFPVASHGGYRLALTLKDLYVMGVGGTGIISNMNGGVEPTRIHGCSVYGNYGVGFQIGSDTQIRDCHAIQAGFEGFKADNTNITASNLTASGNGWVTGSRGIGFLFTGAGSGIVASSLYAQDNRAQGMKITGQRVNVSSFTADDNSASSLTTYAGLELNNCSMTTVNGYVSTDRFDDTPILKQGYGLKVVNGSGTNFGNRVQFVQAGVDGGVMLAPVDPASDLNGTEVIVGASGGGQIALPVVSTAITPDPYRAQTQVVTLAANLVTVNAPTNNHKGCRLRFLFIQDATGGRTLPTSWNAAYKTATISNSGNTASKRSSFEFEHDGTNWTQVSAANTWI